MAKKPPAPPPPPPPPPLTKEDLRAVDAPWPLIDRYPIVLGSGITLTYVSTALRVCTTGYRQQFVDLFDELLERDGHAQAMCDKRVQTIAGGRLDLQPAELPPGDPEEALAQEIADACRQRIQALPDLTQRLANLAWADILAVSALETVWGEDNGFWPEKLLFVHSRRLSYPDPMSWDLHLWDQGQVVGWAWDAPTNRPGWGLNLGALPPGKFIVHTPQHRNSYPTREGLGRALLWLMAFKILGMRQGSQFIERFTKILLWATYTTRSDGHPQQASPDDIQKAKAALDALGVGNLTAAVLADAIQVKMDGPALKGTSSTLTVEAWVDLCDAQTTKLLVGSTFTTEPGKFGSRGTTEVGKEGELEGARFAAGMLAETLRRDLVVPMVERNWPGRKRLAPRVAILLDKPNPGAIVDLAVKAAGCGIPVDADDVAQKAGLRTVSDDDPKARRMAPVRPQDPGALARSSPSSSAGPPGAPPEPAASGDQEPA